MNSACPIDCHDLAATFNFKEWDSQQPTIKSTLRYVQVGVPWDYLVWRGHNNLNLLSRDANRFGPFNQTLFCVVSPCDFHARRSANTRPRGFCLSHRIHSVDLSACREISENAIVFSRTNMYPSSQVPSNTMEEIPRGSTETSGAERNPV